MSGTTTNARIWDGADWYVWDGAGDPVIPTDPFSDLDAGWKALGLISQDGGISFTNSITETKHYAHGNILVRKSYTEAEKTAKIEALEDSDLVWRVANPGSQSYDAGGGVTKRVEKPLKPSQAIWPSFIRLTDGDDSKAKYMPRVQIMPDGDQQVTDNDIAGYPLVGTVLTDTISAELASEDDAVLANGIEWTNQAGAAVVSA